MNFVNFVNFPSYGYFVLSPTPLKGHDKTKLTHPYKYTKFTKFTEAKVVRGHLLIIMNKLIKYTPFHTLFDVLVYLCELIKALSVFLCIVAKIQHLNFVNLCELHKLEVHTSSHRNGG